jgi:23S rRNA (uracil1939-C5)-methyltransferase
MIARDPRTVDCPHRRECGACSLLLVPNEEQLERKRRRLLEALERALRLDRRRVQPTLPSPRIAGYRNRAKMAISSDRARRSKLGHFQRRSREVVDVPHGVVSVVVGCASASGPAIEGLADSLAKNHED